MSTLMCPHCGYAHTFDHASDDIDAQILKAIASTERHSGRATTRAIASVVYLSDSQTGRHLRRLERSGRVKRIGVKGGWRAA